MKKFGFLIFAFLVMATQVAHADCPFYLSAKSITLHQSSALFSSKNTKIYFTVTYNGKAIPWLNHVQVTVPKLGQKVAIDSTFTGQVNLTQKDIQENGSLGLLSVSFYEEGLLGDDLVSSAPFTVLIEDAYPNLPKSPRTLETISISNQYWDRQKVSGVSAIRRTYGDSTRAEIEFAVVNGCEEQNKKLLVPTIANVKVIE